MTMQQTTIVTHTLKLDGVRCDVLAEVSDGRLVRLVIESVNGGSITALGLRQVRFSELFPAPSPTPGEDNRLGQVADLYNATPHKPAQRVAVALGLPRTTATRLIRQARRVGLIPLKEDECD